MKNYTDKNFIRTFHDSARACWDLKAVSDFTGESLTYSGLAREIKSLHLLWKKAGLKAGDKVAINARSSKNWVVAFMASVTGGYVSVQLFNGFTPSDTQNLVNHSDSRILYTEKEIFSAMDFEASPQLLAAIDTKTLEILASRDGFDRLYAERYEAFDAMYPAGFSKEDFELTVADMEDICAIMYTSGSTGNPKGVMLRVKNFSANVELVKTQFPMYKGENHLSVLPYAHIFGLAVDMLTPLCAGMALCVLGLPPLPKYLKEAFMQLRPRSFFAVPLILTKYTDYILGSIIRDGDNQKKLDDYKNNPELCERLRSILIESMGGQMELFATGGAAIPYDIEELLAFKIKMPFITGYGMTETAPVISLGPAGGYKARSCGKVYEDYLEVKINSIDPHNIPGEVCVRGQIVFAGYYKNEDATKEVLSEDGWLRTGDIGVIDEDNVLFLSGRCKNMILSSNGQNIFPEEIEVILNGLPYVAESLVVMRNGAINAIVVPNGDAVAAAGFDADTLKAVMDGNIRILNTKIPKYSAVSACELRFEPFAKTPKGSIKRFMYV